MQITTDAVVIRTKSFNDDRILTLLTKEMGVITAYGKGAKKPKGKLTSSTELMCYSRFVLFKNKDQYWVDNADAHKIFFGVRSSIEKLSLGSYICELCSTIAHEGEDTTEHLRLLLNSLHILEDDKRSPFFIKPVFELRILTLCGYMPDLVACCICGNHNSTSFSFLPQTGQLICDKCKINSVNIGVNIPLSPAVLKAMQHIIYSPFEKIFSFTLEDKALKSLRTVAEVYLLNQLEFSPLSLSFLNSVI